MRDTLDAGYVPMRPGESLRAITGLGAEVSLKRREKYASIGRAVEVGVVGVGSVEKPMKFV